MGQLITLRRKEEPIGGCLSNPVYEAGGETEGRVYHQRNKKDKPIGGCMSSSSI